MPTILIDKLPRIIKARKKLEKELNVKITNIGKEVTIQGNPEDEYIAEKVLDAIDMGFLIQRALLLKDEEFLFEKINIKSLAKKKNMEMVRGRIIGTGGRTLATISLLTDCFFEIKDNEVGIIGHAENIKNAEEAIKMLVKGSKQGNVYAYLEHHKPEPVIDLDLK